MFDNRVSKVKIIHLFNLLKYESLNFPQCGFPMILAYCQNLPQMKVPLFPWGTQTDLS